MRPLPHNITDRLFQEPVEYIIDFLSWDMTSLSRCALVSRTWFHHSQTLLYSCVEIASHAGYHSIVDFVMSSPRTKRYLRHTRLLSITTAREDWTRSQAQRNYFPTLPLVLVERCQISASNSTTLYTPRKTAASSPSSRVLRKWCNSRCIASKSALSWTSAVSCARSPSYAFLSS